MPAASPLPSPTRTEYRATTGYRAILLTVVPLAVAGIGYGTAITWQEPHKVQLSKLAFTAGALLAAIFLIHILVAAFKSAFVIADDRVIEQNVWPFADKELLLTEIAGFRISEKYTSIHPAQPDLPTLKIASFTESYPDLQFWLSSQYPDLDQTKAATAMAALLAEERLGSIPEEQTDRLAQAKRVGTVLNVLGSVVAVWIVSRLGPYPYAVAAGLAFPLLVVGALVFFSGLIHLEVDKKSPYVSVALALLAPTLMLAGRGATYGEPVAYATAWPLVGEVTIAFALLLILSNRHALLKHGTPQRGSSGEWTMLLLCAAAYGFGATLTGNTAFDQSRPTLYPARVLAKYKETGKSTSYYLTLSPWGLHPTSENVTVSHAYYDAHASGDTVRVIARPGRLGIAWFQLEE